MEKKVANVENCKNAIKEHGKIDLEFLDKPLQVSLDNPFDADNSTAMKSKQKLKCKAKHSISKPEALVGLLAFLFCFGAAFGKTLKKECKVVIFQNYLDFFETALKMHLFCISD